MNITINELSRKTGISASEIRRRVHNGLPHIRVGAKRTKILIDEDYFKKLITNESLDNITLKDRKSVPANNDTDTVGYGRLRKID